jgi:large subunit ribosomal protein L7Ae
LLLIEWVQPKAPKSKSKQPAPAPYKATAGKVAAKPKKEVNPLFESKKLNFGIGQTLPKGLELSRYVKWPRYVKLQRQRKILYQRLKVPPAIAQFSDSLNKNAGMRTLT